MQIKIGDYEFLSTHENLLGKGAYGQVYRCKKMNTQEEYCVKVLNKANFKDSVTKSLNIQSDVFKQIQTQNCGNLVQIYDVIDEQDYLYIIMEICDYDLQAEFRILKKKNTWYTENDQIEIIQQIVKGFQSLYLMNIIHRNIKPQNILVKIINKDTPQQQKIYKISGFSFSQFLENLLKRENLARVGTPSYAAPQLFFEHDFSGKCDIYSFGVVFYIIAHQGQTLTPDRPPMSQIKNFLLQLKTNPVKCQIQEGKYKLELSNLIERMLVYSEEDRINFEDIFKHPVMKIFNSKDSIFFHIPEQQYLKDKIVEEEKEKINQRLEQIHKILSVFYRKFLFFQNTIKQLHLNTINTRAVALYLYQLGLYQLTYAMGMINVSISDIHKSFKEDNNILHLLEILEECKIAVQNNYQEKKFQNKISLDYFKWKKEMIQYNDEFQKYQYDQQKSYIFETYLGYSKEVLAKRFSEQQILASLTTLINSDLGFPQKLQQQLFKACNLETLFPIEKYLNINLDDIFDML